jgi:hypothetical protein
MSRIVRCRNITPVIFAGLLGLSASCAEDTELASEAAADTLVLPNNPGTADSNSTPQGNPPVADAGPAASTDTGSVSWADTTAPSGACSAAGDLCLDIIMPVDFPGGAARLAVTMYQSLPPAGPPNALGTEIANPALVANTPFPVEISGVELSGPYYLYVVVYMPGGGEWTPSAGIDYVGTSNAVVLGSGAVTLNSPIELALAGGTGPVVPEPEPEPGPDTDPPSTGPIPTFSRVTLFSDLPGAAYLKAADLNEDGFNELLLTSLSEGLDFDSIPPLADGGAYILRRNGGAPTPGSGVGTWSSEKMFDQTAGYGFPNDSELYDVDNDGIEDWVIGGGFIAKEKGYLLWMKGAKNGSEHTFSGLYEIETLDSARWYHEIIPVDLDNDGDLDFLTTNNASKIQGLDGLQKGPSRLEWFENLGIPGEASFVPHIIGDTGGALFTTFDLDEDGDMDVVLPQYFGGESLVWVENPGNPFDTWIPHVINDTTGKGFDVEVVDLDGDGQPEILYGNHNHQNSVDPEEQVMGIYWFDRPALDELSSLENWDDYLNVLYEGFYIPADDPEQDGAPGVIHAGDIDLDGDLDVTASGDGDKGVYLFVQQEPGKFDKVTLDTGLTMAGDHVMMDLDADGDMDLVWCIFGESGFTGIQSYVYAYIQDGVTDSADPEPGTNPGDGSGPSTTDNDPMNPGAWSYGQTTATLNVADGAFGTTIPLNIYIPNGEGPFPVVVMMDGFSLSGDLYDSYGKHFASWGYLTVFVDVPNNIIQAKTAIQLKDYFIATFDWISGAGASVLGNKADMSQLVVAGHSAGAKAAVHVTLFDYRPKGAFAIDPVDSGPPFTEGPTEDYPSIAPELMDQITVPLVLLGETTNGGEDGALGTPCAPLEDNFQQYYAAATSPALEIDVLGASHMSFLDNPNCGLDCAVCPAGTDDPTVTRKLTQRYMTAFFNMLLKSDDTFKAYLTGAQMQSDMAEGFVVSQSKNGF